MLSPKWEGHHSLPVYRSSIIGHTKSAGRVLHGRQDASKLTSAVGGTQHLIRNNLRTIIQLISLEVLMHIQIAILFLLFSLTPILSPTIPGSSDEAAIREVIKNYVDARERIDPKAVEQLFTSDADQLVSSGEWRKGRAAVVRGTMASSNSSGGKRTITVESVRVLASDVAIADGRYELTGLAGGVTRSMWTTFVLKRSGKEWRITAIRNMLPAAPAPSK